MAHKKGGGSTRNGRDSNPQFRGVKAYGGQVVGPGSIIVRQVGTKFGQAGTCAWVATAPFTRWRRAGFGS